MTSRTIAATALLAALLPAGVTLQAQTIDPAAQGQAPQVEEHPLLPAIRYAQSSLDVVSQLNDYTATLTKRELINGRLTTQSMVLKFREEPFSVYMQYGDPHSGREILYVEGRNQNQLLAHEGQGLGALAGTLTLDPTGQRAMAENRHPVTDLGLKRMLELVLEQWEIESEYGEIEVLYYPDARLGNIACEVIETAHPRPRRQFRYQTTRLYFDSETHLPIRIENFGFPQNPAQQPPLVEEYTYLNIQTNVGLADRDFDDRNQQYGFR